MALIISKWTFNFCACLVPAGNRSGAAVRVRLRDAAGCWTSKKGNPLEVFLSVCSYSQLFCERVLKWKGNEKSLSPKQHQKEQLMRVVEESSRGEMWTQSHEGHRPTLAEPSTAATEPSKANTALLEADSTNQKPTPRNKWDRELIMLHSPLFSNPGPWIQ